MAAPEAAHQWFAGSTASKASSRGSAASSPTDGALPSISLPKGGGAIRGIDEQLSVNRATGTASLTVGVFTSPARQGFGPKLALSYDSGAGNSPFGLGWSASVPQITRKTNKGLPRYDGGTSSDVFVISGAEDLIPLLEAGAPVVSSRTVAGSSFIVAAYRPRVEAGFARIERWTQEGTGEVHWRTISPENVTSLYGQTPQSRISDPLDSSRTFSWLLDLSFDDRGNAVSYVYKPEDRSGVAKTANEANRLVEANRYLKRVLYGNRTPYLNELPTDWCFELVLDYGEHNLSTPTPTEQSPWSCRPDPFSSYRATFEVRTYRRCRRLLMFHRLPELGEQPVLVRSTDLTYGQAPTDPRLPTYSLLTSVTQTGWLARSDGAYDTAQLPALELDYSALEIDERQRTPEADSLQNLTGSRQRWIDLEGEGLAGLLSEDEFAWYYKRNVSAWDPHGGPPSARLEPLTQVAEKPAPGSLTLTDLNGHGRLSAVKFAPPDPGWFEYDADAGWSPFQQFATANIDWASANVRFVDVNGDGLADVLVTEDDAFSTQEWVLESGFAPGARVTRQFDEERGPGCVFADSTHSVFLADMSGDGLTDLVRIRNGEVCYWPNLGYGRFGAKVAMDDAPDFDFADRFDARQIRLADIDGTGAADIVYLGEQATIWFNQSGNSWTARHVLGQSPRLDSAVEVSVHDLLGTGTACLVWSSGLPEDRRTPLRYIELTGSVKPHLLKSARNNLGAQRTLSYAPSTKFYLADRAAGTPWLTRLPFPVHVVERVETLDSISRTSSVSNYSYHHGFYDGIEREFRGFARVDVLDSDVLPSQSGTGTFTETPPVSGESFDLPPVLTRTWFHTGVWFDREDLAARLSSEYYALDAQAPKLGDSILPSQASAAELREACRALRGRMLREEVYAQDGGAQVAHPYMTRECRYEVDPQQAATTNAHGGFYAWERESIACHYERNQNDPRVTHEISLAIDPYGKITRRASIGYPRRTPVFPEQATTWVRYVEIDIVNLSGEADSYRLGLPVETRTYGLTGVPPASAGLYDPTTLASDAAAAAEIPYEATASGIAPQRRLLSRQRTIYRHDDLSGPLPRGSVQPLAILDATYSLRYTPGLLSATFAAKLTPGVLQSPGGFVDLDGDGNQWAPSSRVFYSPDPVHPDTAYARAHFYLPQGAIDPWGHVSSVAYDSHDLLTVQAVDAAGNTTVAQSNYRVLGPWLITDPNLNRSGVRYDALGMVSATAVMGKSLQDGSDEGDHLDTTTAEAAPGDDPTARLDYDLSAYSSWATNPARDVDHPAPVWVHTMARVRHKDPTSPWLESYAYSDGFGRVVLSKQQAEPGPAPQRNLQGTLQRDEHGALIFTQSTQRWVGSGRVVHDNKGNPVKSYEPFFDSSPVYDDESDLVEWGVTTITRYDPLGRPIRVENPNGTYRSVDFDPWHTASSDENDNVLSSAWYAARSGGGMGAEQADAAMKAAFHAATPTTSDLDSLGRTFRSVADNGAGGQYATTVALDIDGRAQSTTDALGRVALTRDYDMAGAEIHSSSIDAGERWLLSDAGGQPLRSWDNRGNVVRFEYDSLLRLSNLYLTSAANPERLSETVTYGEALGNGQALNLRGAPYQRRDGSGVATTLERDFKGNILSASRQLLSDYRDEVDWAHSPALDTETFTTNSLYDALNRVTRVTTPDGSLTVNGYNVRGLLTSIAVNGVDYLSTAAYDAKAQRERVEYGNGTSTTYAYDPYTFRLVHLQSTRPGATLQDLSYIYDPVGNVTRLLDAAQQAIFFANQIVTPNADYTYDALYRLLAAEGREHIGQSAVIGWDDAQRVAIPLPSDGQAMRNYKQSYTYDAVGNIQKLAHSAAGGSFTREYAYATASNRLSSSTVAASTETYEHDEHGNLTSMPHLSLMSWDWKDQLEATATQILGEGTPETTYYRYDAGAARVRKVTDRQGATLKSQRIYLGSYELYREYGAGGAVTTQRETLHVAGVGLLETNAGEGTLARYQLADRLGSATLELDENAAIVSYEEYYPFGSTSFQSGVSAAEVSLKRYRYTGKERDGESGLYYNGARYYAPWLARWTAVDPAGFVDGLDGYAYVRNNPIGASDPSGRQAEPPGYGLGPFRLTNPRLTGVSGLNAHLQLDLSGLFSGDASVGVSSADASGTAFLASGVEIPSLHLSGGTGTYRVDLSSIRLLHGVATADISGRATLSAGPLSLDLDLSAYGETRVPGVFKLGNFSEQLADMANDFRGFGSVFGRVSAGGLTFGAFDLSADAHGTQGTLDLRAWVGLPSLDNGPAINIGSLRGSGTFNNGQYDIGGSFKAGIPPFFYGFGTFSLSSGSGLGLDANYFGPQFGPLGLAPGIDPFAHLRPANINAKPGDQPDLLQSNAPASPTTTGLRETLVFQPGTSLGYSHFSLHDSTYRIFSVGVSLPSLTRFSPDIAPLKGPLAAPGLDTLLYGQSLSTGFGKYGVYFGASYGGTF
jgi:RHS repeat-associated protein